MSNVVLASFFIAIIIGNHDSFFVIGVKRTNTNPSLKEVVCKNMDIRNKLENLQKLENCTVIEGFLQILLMNYDSYKEKHFENLSYPNLREITDYFLLYRVHGLRSLTKLFPNLTVIRGHTLFFNYALVSFEMPDLEDIGLVSLSVIVRGAVRFEKNPELCYINTIDWMRIATSVIHMNDHKIIQNKDVNECVNVCPKGFNDIDTCEIFSRTIDGKMETSPLCWNSDHCQKICPDECSSKTCYISISKKKCCHEQCLGGCYGPSHTECYSCKNVTLDGVCLETCPKNRLKYLNRRCITVEQCRTMHEFLDSSSTFMVHKDLCVEECPSGYIEGNREDINGDPHLCMKCEGTCPKVCHASEIDSVAAAQDLKGCTVIEGSLEIQIRGGNQVGLELLQNLGEIEIVTDYITIMNSPSLTSFDFLKNLKTIKGDHLFRDQYGLFVFDNDNLQDIWDFKTHPNLEIKNGGLVSFGRNSKLCYAIIMQLVESLNITNLITDQEVSRENNGYLAACTISRINLTVLTIQSKTVILNWTKFIIKDVRLFMYYIIHYREAKYRNITIFSGRDACGVDLWRRKHVEVPESHKDKSIIPEFLTNLSPYTQYAVYVETYVVSESYHAGMSDIVYFTTDTEYPTNPRDVVVKAEKHGQLNIKWKPPSNPYGNVTHYYIHKRPLKVNRDKIDKRDYCIAPLIHESSGIEPDVKHKKDNSSFDSNCCRCPKTKEESRADEEERSLQIRFENFLHSSVYAKRPSADSSDGPNFDMNRYKRSTNPNSSIVIDNSSHDILIDTSSMSSSVRVDMKTNVILTNLSYFQEYYIEIKACHGSSIHTEKCSNPAFTTARTLHSLNADIIDMANVSIHNITGGRVLFKWLDPIAPNGLIVAYYLRYQEIGNKDYKYKCIPHKEYFKNNGTALLDVKSGNYSFNVRAMSLAGKGNWTNAMYFFIPENPTQNSNKLWYALGFGILLFLIFVIVYFCYMHSKRSERRRNMPDSILYASYNPEYISAADVYNPDEWEVARDDVHLLKELGQGHFGMVYHGNAKNLLISKEPIEIAVKTVNEKATFQDRVEFLNEASVMKAFTSNHVVKLLGVVSIGQPVLVLMELMMNGDLKTYLRKSRPADSDVIDPNAKPPTLKELLKMAAEIADGMFYLSDKKFVHRDLAARNCMVAINNTVKIGDFGMTRNIYATDYYRKDGKGLLPVRWMSPESLKDGVFSKESDIWSYGVVLWEMVTLAALPYQGLSNKQVLKYVTDGGIMEKSEGCPEKIYDIMSQCWNYHAKDRPSFKTILEILIPDLNSTFMEVSYYSSEERYLNEKLSYEKQLQSVCEAEDDNVTDINTPLTSQPDSKKLKTDNCDKTPSSKSSPYINSNHIPCKYDDLLNDQSSIDLEMPNDTSVTPLTSPDHSTMNYKSRTKKV